MTNAMNIIKSILKISLFIVLLVLQGCTKEYCCYREAKLGECNNSNPDYDNFWPTEDDCLETTGNWTDAIDSVDKCFTDEQACKDTCKAVACEETK